MYTMYKPTPSSFTCETKSFGTQLTAFKNSKTGKEIESLLLTQCKFPSRFYFNEFHFNQMFEGLNWLFRTFEMLIIRAEHAH